MYSIDMMLTVCAVIWFGYCLNYDRNERERYLERMDTLFILLETKQFNFP